MNPNRPAIAFCLAMLSAASLRVAVAAPLAPSSEDGCIRLYHDVQDEAQRRFAQIGGDYARGWSTPGMHYPTLSARALSGFKDTDQRAIRRRCADDARAMTMDRLNNAIATARKYDGPFVATVR